MDKEKSLSPVSMILLVLSLLLSACSENTPVTETASPVLVKPMTNRISAKELALIGERVVFGKNNPQFGKGDLPIGKGRCPLCHMFHPDQRADRGPVLIGVWARSHSRVKEERYKMFVDHYSKGEPNSGIKPHAQTGGEYILESEYCPNCYSPEGFGIKGTNDMESAMPIMNKPPINLTDFEIVAVLAYYQMKDTPGDYSKITAIEDWEHYFGKKFTFTPEDVAMAGKISPAPLPVSPFALASDTVEQIVTKMACIACHKIPGLEVGKSGMVGPLLIMKTNAANRIKSPEYRKAVKDGRAHATTPREYVIESITHPAAFIVPGFADDMLKDYRHKFTLAGFDKLVDYLMEQDEAAAIKSGLDRLPNEREGSLRKGQPFLERSE